MLVLGVEGFGAEGYTPRLRARPEAGIRDWEVGIRNKGLRLEDLGVSHEIEFNALPQSDVDSCQTETFSL